MILARVVGTVVATRKDPRLDGKKLLVAREKYGIKAPVKISDTCPRVQPGEPEGTITLTKEELVDIIQAALERLKHHND